MREGGGGILMPGNVVEFGGSPGEDDYGHCVHWMELRLGLRALPARGWRKVYPMDLLTVLSVV